MLQNLESFSEKNGQLKKELKPKLLIFACLLLPYRVNGFAICLPFSIGTVRSLKTVKLLRQFEHSTVVGRCENRHVFFFVFYANFL